MQLPTDIATEQAVGFYELEKAEWNLEILRLMRDELRRLMSKNRPLSSLDLQVIRFYRELMV